MDIAWKLVKRGIGEWTIIMAREQYAGRGRYGRMWISPTGGLWMSIVFSKKLLSREALLRSHFVSPLAITRVIEEIYGIRSYIKWPNDVVIEGKKVAGVLVESKTKGYKIEGIVVGMGINTNIETDPIPGATSLFKITNKRVDNVEFGKKVFSEFLELLCYRDYLDEYKSRLETLGREVVLSTYRGVVQGKVVDIDNNYTIIIKDKNNKKYNIDYFSVIKLNYV